jgi:hypothetical protein
MTQTQAASEEGAKEEETDTALAVSENPSVPLASASTQPTQAKTVAVTPQTQTSAGKSGTPSRSRSSSAQAAALGEAFGDFPRESTNKLWYYLAGLMGVIALGIGVEWYVSSRGAKPPETSASAGEFKIE